MPAHAPPSAIIQTAGVIVVRGSDCDEVLLLRAYDNWDLPKGVVEPGEPPLHTAMRELQEECALRPQDVLFPWGHQHTVTPSYRTRHAGQSAVKVATFFLAHIPGPPPTLRLSPEHHEACWLTWDDAIVRVVPRLQAVLQWGRGIVALALPGQATTKL